MERKEFWLTHKIILHLITDCCQFHYIVVQQSRSKTNDYLTFIDGSPRIDFFHNIAPRKTFDHIQDLIQDLHFQVENLHEHNMATPFNIITTDTRLIKAIIQEYPYREKRIMKYLPPVEVIKKGSFDTMQLMDPMYWGCLDKTIFDIYKDHEDYMEFEEWR